MTSETLTWRDTIKYGVAVYSFLIRGEGEMSGRKFASIIKKYYSGDAKQSAIISDIEKHIVTICATYKGTKYSDV